jgi:arsenate reductase
VVPVCHEAVERCPIFPGLATILRWSFENPASFTGSYEERLAKTRSVREQIRKKIEEFIAEHSQEGGKR